MAQYGKSEYWEDRYQKDKEPFDWYQRYNGGGLKDIITMHVQTNCQILNIGAGNSRKFFYFSNHSTFKLKLHHNYLAILGENSNNLLYS